MAHVDAGKTTLTESLLYHTGMIRTRGRVDDGTAPTDSLLVERNRGISVKAQDCSFIYKNEEITLIDTPGHVDFSGEVERSLAAVDGACLLLSAVEGVQAHTETIWQSLRALHIPTILFINKVDRVGADPEGVLLQAEEIFGIPAIALNAVVDPGNKEARVVQREDLSQRLTEVCCDFSDEAEEAFLNEQIVDTEKALTWAQSACEKNRLLPVVYGAALYDKGVACLLEAMVTVLPKAKEKDDGLSALVYRVEHDAIAGRIAHIRLISGGLTTRMTLDYPGGERQSEKIARIRRKKGVRWEDAVSVKAGETAAVCGLSRVKVFDWFGKKPMEKLPELANPYLQVRVSPEKPDELTALVHALGEMEAEDPHLAMQWVKSEREIIISITGIIEKEVLSDLLKERYGLKTAFSQPSVIYKERPLGSTRAYADYLMPKPCWAIVEFLFEPLPVGSGVVYDGGHIPHDQLNMKYQEHIRRSFFDSIKQGIHGWEVTDFKATLIGGGHHLVHTHPLDFFVATPMAVMNGFAAVGTEYLEPILRCRITAGEEAMGKIINDIVLMRGSFDEPVVKAGKMTVDCLLPVATSEEYPIRLAALTGGRGSFRAVLDSWQPCPEEFCKSTPYRGVNPLDRSRWILYKRGAYTE